MKPLDYFLKPRSIAVIGVPRDEKKYGSLKTKVLLEGGYQNPLYLINPQAPSLFGCKTYPSIMEVDGNPDLVLMMVRAQLVPKIVKDCGDKGVKSMVVISSGFSEVGKEGKLLEERMLKTAREFGLRIIGPNGFGIFSASHNLNMTGIEGLKSGSLSVISQSGNLVRDIVAASQHYGLGFSRIIELGNAADIDFHECIDYLGDDKDTRVILVYMEGTKNGRQLFESLRNATRQKPVIFLKAGKTEKSKQAVQTHTGALAGVDQVFDAMLRQTGAIRVQSVREMLEIAAAFSLLPEPKGNNLVVITDGGGHGIIAIDAATYTGFNLINLDAKTKERIMSLSKNMASVGNPIDVGTVAYEGEPEIIPRCAEVLLESDQVDAVMFTGLLGGYGAGPVVQNEELANHEHQAGIHLANLPCLKGKPILVHTPYAMENIATIEAMKAKMPVYREPQGALKALAKMRDYRSYCDRVAEYDRLPAERPFRPDGIKNILEKRAKSGEKALTTFEALNLVKTLGISTPTFARANSVNEAEKIAKEIGYPVVMKPNSSKILHKSDMGLVLLNLQGPKQIEHAFDVILEKGRPYDPKLGDEGVLVSSTVSNDVEVIIGLNRDEQFGPVVMFGLGGIFVEIMKDVSFRIAPIRLQEGYEMIEETKGVTLLKGVRGSKEKNIAALVEILVKISNLALYFPEIQSIDLNPVIVSDKNAYVVDAKVTLTY